MVKYYPIMLDICEKRCVVIGGGKVAQRKVVSLLEHGAKVTVVSPKVTEKLKKLQLENKINRVERDYKWGDMKGHYLVYVATDNVKVNEECLKEARHEEILINVVDQPDMCDFIVPASVRREDLTITISTNGKSPMLSRKIREDLEETFGEEYIEFLNALGDLRKTVIEEIDDINVRKEVFQKVVYSDLLQRYKNGEVEDIKKAVKEIYTHIV